MAKLRESDVMCAQVLHEKGRGKRSIARELHVDESTIRYRLRRLGCGAVDGRRNQPEACDPYNGVIRGWIERQAVGSKRPDPVKMLYELLVARYSYTGSYRSVLRYVRRRTPPPRIRPVRRVETAAGAQAQVDWVRGPSVYVDELKGLVELSAFVMTLSYSRMWTVVWSQHQDLLSWLDCHNRALRWLGGVPATIRIDNLKTGVASGAGPWAKLQQGYASYARQMGFAINPCRVRQPSDKGKVERRGRDVKYLQIRLGERFRSLGALQEATQQRILDRARQLTCPISGASVHETWQQERFALKPLPQTLPEPFDVQVYRHVSRDCLVSFEGRQYSVPFLYVGRTVDVRGCSQRVEIYHEGRLLASYPRATACRLLVDQGHYEGRGDHRVIRPAPLGELGRQIVLRRSWEGQDVPVRGIEHYAELVETLS